jgi:hypothetical protein
MRSTWPQLDNLKTTAANFQKIENLLLNQRIGNLMKRHENSSPINISRRLGTQITIVVVGIL